MSMADDDRHTLRKPSQEEQYLRLLKGEITSEEFVKDLKDAARSTTDQVARRSRGAASATPQG
jgi:hypothetical protein